MAKEYIDREAAANIFSRARSAMRPEDYSTFDEMNTRDLMLLNAEQVIRMIPAADVVEVRHGHYVGEYDGYADGNPVYDMWYCSECGCCFEEWDEKPTYNYCPNCGAKMEAEE